MLLSTGHCNVMRKEPPAPFLPLLWTFRLSDNDNNKIIFCDYYFMCVPML